MNLKMMYCTDRAEIEAHSSGLLATQADGSFLVFNQFIRNRVIIFRKKKEVKKRETTQPLNEII